MSETLFPHLSKELSSDHLPDFWIMCLLPILIRYIDFAFLFQHSYFTVPDTRELPSIPENRNLTEYFVAVDVNNMLHLYASMLYERRILIICSKLSTVSRQSWDGFLNYFILIERSIEKIKENVKIKEKEIGHRVCVGEVCGLLYLFSLQAVPNKSKKTQNNHKVYSPFPLSYSFYLGIQIPLMYKIMKCKIGSNLRDEVPLCGD